MAPHNLPLPLPLAASTSSYPRHANDHSHHHGHSQHKWTPYELHTLFCLLCRNLHITGFDGTAMTTNLANSYSANTASSYRGTARSGSGSGAGATTATAAATTTTTTTSTGTGTGTGTTGTTEETDILFGRHRQYRAQKATPLTSSSSTSRKHKNSKNQKGAAHKTLRPSAIKYNHQFGIPAAHVDVATALNRALHGNGNYDRDIDILDVSSTIDFLLQERRVAAEVMSRAGMGGRGRVTRAKKRVWERGLRMSDDARVANAKAVQAMKEKVMRELEREEVVRSATARKSSSSPPSGGGRARRWEMRGDDGGLGMAMAVGVGSSFGGARRGYGGGGGGDGGLVGHGHGAGDRGDRARGRNGLSFESLGGGGGSDSGYTSAGGYSYTY